MTIYDHPLCDHGNLVGVSISNRRLSAYLSLVPHTELGTLDIEGC